MGDLQFKRREAVSGKANSMVIFLHGYGADGADLLGLADPLSAHLPDTVFIAPDAPEKCKGNPFGFQWFPIPRMDGSTQAEAEASIATSMDILDDFLDQMLAAEGLTPDRLIVVGFSQGTMMSLEVLPERDQPVAGVVGFSGRLLHPDSFGEHVISRPPVLLVHGDADDMVPIAHMKEAADKLGENGFDVYGHVEQGTAHGIAPDGLSVALTFIAHQLGVQLQG